MTLDLKKRGQSAGHSRGFTAIQSRILQFSAAERVAKQRMAPVMSQDQRERAAKLMRGSRAAAEATKVRPMKPRSHVRVPEFLRTHLDSLSNQEGMLSEATLDYPQELVAARASLEARARVLRAVDGSASTHADKVPGGHGRTLAETLLVPGTPGISSRGAFHVTDLLNRSNSQSPSRQAERPKSFNRLKLAHPN